MPWKFWDNRTATAVTNKEVITSFLQLLSAEGSPEKPLESQPYQMVTNPLWTSLVRDFWHVQGSPPPLRPSSPFSLWQAQRQLFLWGNNRGDARPTSPLWLFPALRARKKPGSSSPGSPELKHWSPKLSVYLCHFTERPHTDKILYSHCFLRLLYLN